jgi:hypothetical protein
MATPQLLSRDASIIDFEKESEAKDLAIENPNEHVDASAVDIEKTPVVPTPQPAGPSHSPRKLSPLKWVLVCLALYSSAFLYGLDTTVAATIQGPAVEHFGAVEDLGWLGIGFSLGSLATILPIGKGFGIFDIKWLFVGSQVMFEAGSALCGGAPSMDALIVGRVWAGAGTLTGSNLNAVFADVVNRRSGHVSGHPQPRQHLYLAERTTYLHLCHWIDVGSRCHHWTDCGRRLCRLLCYMEMGILHQPRAICGM